MKKLTAFACLGLLFAASAPVFAGAQQEKMKNCNKEAKEKALKGDERKAFMKECLSKKAEAPAEKKAEAPAEKKAEAAPADKKAAQQDKMKSCSKEAKEKAMKGDERKKFMSTCLKG